MQPLLNRRELMHGTLALGAGVGVAELTQQTAAAQQPRQRPRFRYCLNTSTIRGQGLSLDAEVDIAAQAGYDGIEPWIREIQAYTKEGGNLKDLKKRLADLGLTVEGAIGFANWIVDDDQKRAEALEVARQDMDLVRQIGGRRIAAPPAGATRQTDLNLMDAARRYHDLLELGREMGVTPQLEMWGPSKTLSRLGELALVGVECGHPDAGFLPDIYHIYRGGSNFTGLGLLNGQHIHVFHLNDYPDNPGREELQDADRVYPGDGAAPFQQILPLLRDNGFQGCFSLELFNRQYWEKDALEVAQTGIEKMREVVAANLPG